MAVNYDLFGFVRYLRDVEGGMAGQYVAGVAVGVRGYTGRGGFVFNKVEFGSVVIPDDVLYSTYRFDYAGSPLSPEPVACPIGWSYPYLYSCILS